VLTGRLSIDATACDHGILAHRLARGGYFVYLIYFAGLTGPERSRVFVMIALFRRLCPVYRGPGANRHLAHALCRRYTDRVLFGCKCRPVFCKA